MWKLIWAAAVSCTLMACTLADSSLPALAGDSEVVADDQASGSENDQWDQAIAAMEAEDFNTAQKLLQPFVDENNPEAMMLLGELYFTGQGVGLDYARAKELFETAIDLGATYAVNPLSFMYEYGAGVEADPRRALRMMIEAAEAGDEAAAINVGVRYYEGSEAAPRNYDQAVYYFNLAVDNAEDDPASATLYYLSLVHWYGRGVQEDKEMAVEFLQAAAEGGYIEAQIDIAELYRYGDVVEQNEPLAFKWYLIAAENGGREAQWEVGMYYVRGDQVEHDAILAVEWFRKSAGQDYSKGLVSLGVMYATGDGTEQSFETAFDLYMRAAESGNGQGAKNIGVMYTLGQFVEQSPFDAAVWFDIGAMLGSDEAAGLIDELRKSNSKESNDEVRRAANQWLTEQQLGDFAQ